MTPEACDRAVAADLHTNVIIQKTTGPEHRSERRKYFGKGETISLLFWARRLLEIRVDLDLPSGGDSEAYAAELRKRMGKEARTEWGNLHGLEEKRLLWEKENLRVTYVISARGTYLLYQDSQGLQTMQTEINEYKRRPPDEVPGIQ